MVYEVIKPFTINGVEFYKNDTFTAEQAGGWFTHILQQGCIRAKSAKRIEKEQAK